MDFPQGAFTNSIEAVCELPNFRGTFLQSRYDFVLRLYLLAASVGKKKWQHVLSVTNHDVTS